MPTVEIDGVDYPSYATLEEADTYMAAVIGETGDAWRAALEIDRCRSLATSYRALSRLDWKPGAEDDPAWQSAIVPASIEYAAALIEGSFFEELSQSGSGIKRLKADTAEMEFYGAGMKMTASSRLGLPSSVWDLINGWLVSSGNPGGRTFVSGTCGVAKSKQSFSQRF